MEKTDKLTEAISGMYFGRELALDELCFAPADDSNPESADLILTLGDLGILICRIAGAEDLAQACTDAKKRIVRSVRMISAGTLPAYRNCQGKALALAGNPVMFSLIVVEDSLLRDNCTRILEKQNPEDIVVNCVSDAGFQKICQVLVSPMELIHYLYYRELFYARHQDKNLRPEEGENLLSLFLSDRYGYRETNRQKFHLEEFRSFLRELPGHIQKGGSACSVKDVALFMSHLSREESAAFTERMQVLIKESKRGASGLMSSLRPRDDRYAVFFVGKETFPMAVIRNMFCGKSNVRKILEIITHPNRNDEYQVEFLMEEVA